MTVGWMAAQVSHFLSPQQEALEGQNSQGPMDVELS